MIFKHDAYERSEPITYFKAHSLITCNQLLHIRAALSFEESANLKHDRRFQSPPEITSEHSPAPLGRFSTQFFPFILCMNPEMGLNFGSMMAPSKPLQETDDGQSEDYVEEDW